MNERTQKRLKTLAAAARESETIAAEDRAARNAAIVEADDDGHPLRAIAVQVEMSVAQVQRIVVTATADRQQA